MMLAWVFICMNDLVIEVLVDTEYFDDAITVAATEAGMSDEDYKLQMRPCSRRSYYTTIEPV